MERIQSSSMVVTSLSWCDVQDLSQQLASDIRRSGVRADVIVGVLRGGCIPSVMLSHILEIETCCAIGVRTTVSEVAYAARHSAKIDALGLAERVGGKRVLLVDDVGNTGTTLGVAASCIESCGCTDLRSAILVRDTFGGNLCKVDFVPFSVDTWVRFPWEIAE